jgi:hypothetical protein
MRMAFDFKEILPLWNFLAFRDYRDRPVNLPRIRYQYRATDVAEKLPSASLVP